ncbi:hypothetical protein [Neorhizobium alkalisoli]|uniref:hypothetical protein n=1 Tax=Neorhizobium alkalisoli TaxID=528178 RepID=UPI0011A53877|nr:hypothetical protein [Neorhizobium alkalisoli]
MDFKLIYGSAAPLPRVPFLVGFVVSIVASILLLFVLAGVTPYAEWFAESFMFAVLLWLKARRLADIGIAHRSLAIGAVLFAMAISYGLMQFHPVAGRIAVLAYLSCLFVMPSNCKMVQAPAH